MTDRTESGQFQAGVSGNPKGRPKGTKNQIVELKREVELAVREHADPRRIKKVMEKVFNKAANGNMAAAKLVFDYFLSRPTDSEDETNGNRSIKVIVENATFKVENQQERPAQVVEVKQVEEIPNGRAEEAEHRS